MHHATAEDPGDYSAVLGTGRRHRLQGELDAAVADFTRAHSLQPRAARPLCERGAIGNLMNPINIAHARLLLGDVPGALAGYQRLAGEIHAGKQRSGSDVALHDLELLAAAGVVIPEQKRVIQVLQSER